MKSNRNEIELPKFFECGGCDCYHPLGFVGDCRDDEKRFNLDDENNMVNYFGHGYRAYTYDIVPEDYEEVGWARLAYFIPTLFLVGLYCFVAGRLWGYVTTEFIKRIGG